MNKFLFGYYTQKKNNYRAILTFILVFCFLILSKKAYAEQDFKADYNISYKVAPTGETEVTNGITIINLSKDVIATTYNLVLKQLDIYGIEAVDSQDKKIDVIRKSNDSETSLDVRFNSFVIGEGNKTFFVIKYKSRFIANKIGEIWNINIPRTQSDTTNDSKVSLEIPKTFGPKIYISPTPTTESETENSYLYTFTHDLIKNSNISASFGNFQVLNFKLSYQIYNPNRFSSNYEIALPPTIKGSQLVTYEDINPTPASTHTDVNGNYIAVYKLKPQQELHITLTGNAKVAGKQIDPTTGGTFSSINKNLLKLYTSQDHFWETESETVQNLAKNLKDTKLNVSQNAHKIYKYLVENYNYDFDIAKKDFVDRNGAVKALSDKNNWGCMEFTDSFIALARAMGIPAREINGYAINATENTRPISIELKSGDLLHAWPEYYDPKLGWIQVDPTWGNTSDTDYFTKLDTNHFAFVIKGTSSSLPLPAGAYRTSDAQKLVEVAFSQLQNKTSDPPKIEIKKAFNWNLLKIIQKQDKIIILSHDNKIFYLPDGRQLLPKSFLYAYVNRDRKDYELSDAFDTKIKQIY